MPKLRGAAFQTAAIERCRRRETSVEEAIIEMRPAGASTGCIEDVGEILWGAGVSAGTVSNLNEKAYESVEEWRSGPLAGEYPHVFTDGVYLKRSWGGSYENAGVLVATGVDGDGRREIIGCAGGSRSPRARGGSRCGRGAAGPGASAWSPATSAGAWWRARGGVPPARCQRCTVHFYRNVFSKVPRQKRTLVAKMLRAIRAQESKGAAVAKAGEAAAGPEGMRLGAAARVVREGRLETPTYTDFPMRHWTRIRTNNAIERLNREIRRRTRVVGTFPDGRSALMPVTARLKYIAECEWGKRRYLDVSLLENEEVGA